MFLQIFKRSLAFSALSLLFLVCNTSTAGVLLSYTASPNQIFQGGTGSIDVTLKNTGSVDQDVLSFDFTLEATLASGITFTSIEFPLANYIYGPGESVAQTALVPSLGSVDLSGLSVTGSDAWNLFPVPGKILTSGQTVLLGTIQFEVDANATPGIHTLNFTQASFFQLVLPDDLAPLDFDIETPGITVVQNVSAVPEPASVLVFLTLAGAVVWKRRRTQTV